MTGVEGAKAKGPAGSQPQPAPSPGQGGLDEGVTSEVPGRLPCPPNSPTRGPNCEIPLQELGSQLQMLPTLLRRSQTSREQVFTRTGVRAVGGWDRVGPAGDRVNTSGSRGEYRGAPVVWGLFFGAWGDPSGSGRR